MIDKFVNWHVNSINLNKIPIDFWNYFGIVDIKIFACNQIINFNFFAKSCDESQTSGKYMPILKQILFSCLALLRIRIKASVSYSYILNILFYINKYIRYFTSGLRN